MAGRTALGFSMGGAGHPLVAHPVGPGAVEVLGGGFRFRLGGEHRLLGAMARLLCQGRGAAQGGQEAGEEARGSGQGDDGRPVTSHGDARNDNHSGRGGLLVASFGIVEQIISGGDQGSAVLNL
jgi:hypothetical protein